MNPRIHHDEIKKHERILARVQRTGESYVDALRAINSEDCLAREASEFSESSNSDEQLHGRVLKRVLQTREGYRDALDAILKDDRERREVASFAESSNPDDRLHARVLERVRRTGEPYREALIAINREERNRPATERASKPNDAAKSTSVLGRMLKTGEDFNTAFQAMRVQRGLAPLPVYHFSEGGEVGPPLIFDRNGRCIA